jgi:hypothetical protein
MIFIKHPILGVRFVENEEANEGFHVFSFFLLFIKVRTRQKKTPHKRAKA